MLLIELSGVSRSFEGEGGVRVEALRDVSLQINAGEFVCITGSSGAGKSTLMNILGCLDRPSSGSYRLAGREVGQLGVDAMAWLRRQVFGFVFQNYNLIDSRNSTENVELPGVYAGLSPRKRKRKARDLLAQLGLSDRADHLPSEMSGGEQQRVAIARALFNGGRIILADEPTGALDRPIGEEVLRALEHLSAEGHTVILISHNSEVAAQAGRRIELRDGQIVDDTGAVNARPSVAENDGAPYPAGPNLLATAREVCLSGWRHLRAGFQAGARLRTILPMVCVLTAVSLGSLALSIGEGLFRDLMTEVNMMGLDVIFVTSATSKSLTVEDARSIEAEIPNVHAATPDTGGILIVSRGDVSGEMNVWGGVDLGERTGRGPSGFRLAQGEFVTLEDDENLAQVAVIGKVTRELLFPSGTDPLGKFILIEGVPFKVKGVWEPRYFSKPRDPGTDPRAYKFNNSIVHVPFSTAAAFLFEDIDHLGVNVFVEDTDLIEKTAAAIRDLGIRRHGNEAFAISYPQLVVPYADQLRARTWGILGTLAAFVLLAGNISNSIIMLMSVRARRREIGIRMAVGARRRDIQWQFFGETLVTGIAGGLLGVAVALAGIPVLAYFDVPAEPTVWYFAAPMALALVLSTLAAVAPAQRAARLDPVKALATD